MNALPHAWMDVLPDEPPPRSWRAHWPLALVVAAFLSLGFIYNVVNPIFEAPDEIQHFYYIKHLADGKGLPVQGSPEGAGTWAQEGSQPPLYYAIGAFLIRGIPTDDAEEILWYNPNANVGTPLLPGNKNRIIHTEREQFPYAGTVQAVHLLRLYSLALSAATVVFSYLIALEVVRRRGLALIAAMAVAFNPQFLFISSAVSNDNMITLLATVGVWLILRMPSPHHALMRRAIPLGVVLGLAAMAKLSGLALWGLAVAALAYLVWSRRLSLRQAAGLFFIWLLSASLISGWWYVRNLRLYGDPTGLSAMLAVVGRRTDAPTLADIWGEFRGLRISFWALFGWFNTLAPEWIYHVLDALSLLALLGLVLALWRRRRQMTPARLAAPAALALWILLVSISLLRWTTITMGSQGRLLFPAIAAIMVLMVRGLAEWADVLPVRLRAPAVALFPAGLFLLAACSPFLIISPVHARPPTLTQPEEVPAEARIEPVTYGSSIRLIGYVLDKDEVHPGDMMGVTLFWECVGPVEEDYNISVKFLEPEGVVLGSVDTYPGWGTFPTSLWSPGEIVPDRYTIPIGRQAAPPALLQMEVAVYVLETMERLPAFDPRGQERSAFVGELRLTSWPPRAYTIPNPTRFLWANGMILEGYDMPAEARAGASLEVSLFWSAAGQVEEDYTVFLHMVDSAGVLHSQYDKPPLDGRYPTRCWRAGETIKDTYTLPLDNVMSGTYWLRVGIYPAADATQRVPVIDDAGRVIAEDIYLVPVRVNP